MSVRQRGSSFEVRWRSKGQKKSRSFASEADARAFDAKVKRTKLNRGASLDLYRLDQSEMGEQVYITRGADKVKIGISAQPLNRMAALQTSCPVVLKIVWRIACPSARELEAALHRRYAEHRSHGEWFQAEPVLADLAELARLGAHQFNAPVSVGVNGDARAATIEAT